MDATFGGAFLAGLISFISPCVLPIVPPYLAYLAGLSVVEVQSDARSAAASRQVLLSSVGFVLGFTTQYKAWVCNNANCGFNIRIDNGEISLGRTIAPSTK